MRRKPQDQPLAPDMERSATYVNQLILRWKAQMPRQRATASLKVMAQGITDAYQGAGHISTTGLSLWMTGKRRPQPDGVRALAAWAGVDPREALSWWGYALPTRTFEELFDAIQPIDTPDKAWLNTMIARVINNPEWKVSPTSPWYVDVAATALAADLEPLTKARQIAHIIEAADLLAQRQKTQQSIG